MSLEDDFIKHDEMIHAYSRDAYPSPYMLSHNYGAWLTRYMAEAYGDESLTEITERNSRRILPSLTLFINNWGSLLGRTVDDSPEVFYEGFISWVDDMYADDVSRILREGETQSNKISPNIYWNNKPDYSPDSSQIAYYHFDQRRDGTVRLINQDGTGDRAIFSALMELPFFRPPYWAPVPMWSPDGTKLIYHRNDYYNRYPIYGDLYMFDVNTKHETRLTEGARAANPVYYLDESTVLFAHQQPNGGSPTLEILDIPNNQVTRLKEFPSDMLLDSFEVSPNKDFIVLSIWHRGFQDIYTMPIDGGELTAVTQNSASDYDPTWSPDGEYILFSSDPDGINNLYAYQLSSGNFYRVTNMLTGAFAPDIAPNASQLAFIGYSTDGYDLHTMSYNPSEWEATQLPIEALPGPVEIPIITDNPISYNPLKYMFPKFWIPIPGLDGMFGGLTAAVDPLQHHEYNIMAGYNIELDEPFYSINYINNQFMFPITIDLIHNGDDHSQGIEIALPLIHKLQSTQTITLGAERSVDRGEDPVAINNLSAGWTWTNNSGLDLFSSSRIVTAMGTLGFVDGSDSPRQSVTFDWRETLTLPIESDHQLALKATAGWSNQVGFALGGSSGQFLMRGFPENTIAGLNAVAASIELRQRLVSIERGILLLPLFIDDLQIALFGDLGHAGDSFSIDSGGMKIGIGVEFQLTFTIGYQLSDLMLVLGVAQGIGNDEPEIYGRFGTAF